MANPFAKATKKKAKLRMALIGPAGSGKTFTAISFASQFGKVAVIDTEHGSASKYADLFEFDTLELTSFDTKAYIDSIRAAVDNGYDAVVIDSLSHAWKELLAQKNQLDAKGGNSFVNWGKMTPKQDALIEAILAAPIHIIATMRAKMEHVQEKDEQGRTSVKKIGLAPVQRDDVEFEFDVVGDIDINNTMVISKSRCVELSGKVYPKPGKEIAQTLITWLSTATVEEPTGVIEKALEELADTPLFPKGDHDSFIDGSSVGNTTPAPTTPAQAEKPANGQPDAITGQPNPNGAKFQVDKFVVNLAQNGNPYLVFAVGDDKYAYAYSREPFKKAGYDTENWKIVGNHEMPVPAIITVKSDSTGKYLNVERAEMVDLFAEEKAS